MSGKVITARTAVAATLDVERQLDAPCPACGASPGRPCTRRNDSTVERDWPHQHRNNLPIVLVDIDGVLADLKPFAGELDPDTGRTTHQRWRRFFAHAAQAPLIESGAELVHALHGAGVRLQYSTTRPSWTMVSTLAWLSESGLPPATVHARGSQNPAKNRRNFPVFDPALVVKQAHCDMVDDRHGLSAFIDDEPQVLEGLRVGGHRALSAADLGTATIGQLRRLRQHRQLVSAR